MNTTKIAILLAHAFVGWALCFATIGIGMAATSVQIALIIHAMAAPIFFAGISMFYFRRFNYTSPLLTATVWITIVGAMDFFVVATLVLHSFEMFTSLLGTWIPFALIFSATFLTGFLTSNPQKRKPSYAKKA